ncbi:TetR/AcrR family transcriptional regulator [Phenylobacterium sp. SCN 70-31]|uniref:TetR/AcrR family transcriptional regulator n=1 Tax=Phenylobacterium sp. SCN 70-31 TaxID=1660129 RepID=UPI00086A58B2|nr:TetR/AcrR family transcriptional regulator [Phenylobacterium sp. SCN 70-31]ODT86157.1 MAG: TetR family transcriptional regulator [Phenylobacterium sp. SCN 70-31]
MPRIAGRIDLSKNEAILDAAVEVLTERGVSASMEEIARRAGVSKQTIYNHYGSKAELIRALMARRVHEITASLETPGAAENPREALAAFARILLEMAMTSRAVAFMRMAMLDATRLADMGVAVFEAGPRASRRKLAQFLALETAAGRLNCPDPQEAAEFFAGMVLGSYQTASLLGVDTTLDDFRIDRLAREAAHRFLRAYAP